MKYGVYLKLSPLSIKGDRDKFEKRIRNIGIDSIIPTPSGAENSNCYWVFFKPWKIGSVQASSLEEAWSKAEEEFGLSYPDIMVTLL